MDKESDDEVEPESRLELVGEGMDETWVLRLLVSLVDTESDGAAGLEDEIAAESVVLV